MWPAGLRVAAVIDALSDSAVWWHSRIAWNPGLEDWRPGKEVDGYCEKEDVGTKDAVPPVERGGGECDEHGGRQEVVP